jgi:hypothetical protein
MPSVFCYFLNFYRVEWSSSLLFLFCILEYILWRLSLLKWLRDYFDNFFALFVYLSTLFLLLNLISGGNTVRLSTYFWSFFRTIAKKGICYVFCGFLFQFCRRKLFVLQSIIVIFFRLILLLFKSRHFFYFSLVKLYFYLFAWFLIVSLNRSALINSIINALTKSIGPPLSLYFSCKSID